MHAPRSSALRILHIVRAPVGGLFRHVCDLAAGQEAHGHAVGLIADSTTGGDAAEAALAALAPRLALGVARIPIARDPGPSDVIGLTRVSRAVRAARPDVLHGHGAKGGACARLVSGSAVRAYTPHGGALHYGPGTWRGRLYGMLERALMPRTDLFLFESAYAREVYTSRMGAPSALVRVVCNGVAESEFAPVAPGPDVTDFLFIGELRRLKGVDILLDALASLRHAGRPVTLTIVGDGPDGETFRAQTARLGLTASVRFAGYRPARDAFALGRVLVLPSRNESLPYIVLEAAAADIPLVATRVGGIPEIFGPESDRLVPPENPAALAVALAAALDDPAALRATTGAVRARVRASFSIEAMVSGVLDGYRAALTPRLVRTQ